MNGIALREIRLTNKMMMMMMIGLCKYSSKSRWMERDGNCLPDVLDTGLIERMKKNSLSSSRFYDLTLLLSSLRVWFTMFS